MWVDHYEVLETLGLYLLFGGIFILIGLAIKDVLTQGKVPPLGRFVVWLVLFLGCAGFIAKGLIQLYWEGIGFS
ncbi:MAG: DUF2788 domain-containing protein [Ferrimonas sp.]